MSRLGAMHSAGLNPTDSEVQGGSFLVYPRWRKCCPGNLVIAGECRGKFGRDESSWVIGGAKISESSSAGESNSESLINLCSFLGGCGRQNVRK